MIHRNVYIDNDCRVVNIHVNIINVITAVLGFVLC
jgi:hypothetical protein